MQRPIPMQRRSFQGFDFVYHDQCSDDNVGSDGVRRPFTRSHSMIERRTPPKPKPKPKPKRPGNGKGATSDAPAIELDEPSAKEIMMEILTVVGKETSKMVGDMMYPGTGRVFSVVFNWVMSLVKGMLWKNQMKEHGSEVDEHEQDQEADSRENIK